MSFILEKRVVGLLKRLRIYVQSEKEKERLLHVERWGSEIDGGRERRMDVTQRDGKATKKESESREEEKTIFHPIPKHLKG